MNNKQEKYAKTKCVHLLSTIDVRCRRNEAAAVNIVANCAESAFSTDECASVSALKSVPLVKFSYYNLADKLYWNLTRDSDSLNKCAVTAFL